jgi:hypothetical protein
MEPEYPGDGVVMTMPRPIAALVLFAFLLPPAFASSQTPPSPRAYPIADAPAALLGGVRRADPAFEALRGALMTELTRALAEGGPPAAIAVCHQQAAAVADRVAREQGIAIGRTSDRLRNPTNAPRPWATAIVARHAARPAAGIDGYVVDLGDRVGVLRPLAMGSLCAGCHGPADQIDPEIREVLLAWYPHDRAVGFREGDLRGWFWAELPKLDR